MALGGGSETIALSIKVNSEQKVLEASKENEKEIEAVRQALIILINEKSHGEIAGVLQNLP